VPSLVPLKDVRAHLAAITRHAAAGNVVLVGSSEKSTFSAFVSLEEFANRRKSFSVNPKNIDIEALRGRWSFEREQVENSGRPLRILRKGEPRAVLVPTPLAIELKVTRTRETLDDGQIELLRTVGKQVRALQTRLDGLTNHLQSLERAVLERLDIAEAQNAKLRQVVELARASSTEPRYDLVKP
jgi:PHD/YefM family antitoxin component YafN of YafNO toxin-antitoxin module